MSSVSPPTSPPVDPTASVGAEAVDDLAIMLESYTGLMRKLQHNHERLSAEVASLKERLASQDEQLQRSRRLAALGEMAAGMAHELRNPLGAIGLYAEMLAEDLGGGDAQWIFQQRHRLGEQATRIVHAVRGLDAIVGDVLTFSREIRPRPRPTSIGRLFDHVISTQAHVLETEGVELDVDLSADEQGRSPIAELDEDLMRQVLLNLVRNAIEAMGAIERGRRRIHLGAAVEDGWMVLRVRDSGPGIATGDLERIFNPFFTTRNTGTGLGLAIVHRIVDAHGGTIAVHNDQGAVFAIHLPRAQPRTDGTVPGSGPTGRVNSQGVDS
ncbi:MAG: GHKL domain-containing protein [Phycisphaeraceae bacterium]|nr:GHKL domain-containing protein [Phycisphaeraceae bacterium]